MERNTDERGKRKKAESVEVIIKPVCLRFSFFEGEVFYHFASNPDAQLDKMESLMGIEPERCGDFTDANLGFLPVCSTVLIRGEKNILIDPGSHHLGFYGLLERALSDKGLASGDIDAVIVTHWHHDHFGNASMFPGAELIVGEGELEFGRALYGAGEVKAKTDVMGRVNVINDVFRIIDGVRVIRTPGHSPGSLCVIIDHEAGRTAVTGDTVMTKEQFEKKRFSHWYRADEKEELNRSVEKIMGYSPSRIIPGHDLEFFVA